MPAPRFPVTLDAGHRARGVEDAASGSTADPHQLLRSPAVNEISLHIRAASAPESRGIRDAFPRAARGDSDAPRCARRTATRRTRPALSRRECARCRARSAETRRLQADGTRQAGVRVPRSGGDQGCAQLDQRRGGRLQRGVVAQRPAHQRRRSRPRACPVPHRRRTERLIVRVQRIWTGDRPGWTPVPVRRRWAVRQRGS